MKARRRNIEDNINHPRGVPRKMFLNIFSINKSKDEEKKAYMVDGGVQKAAVSKVANFEQSDLKKLRKISESIEK